MKMEFLQLRYFYESAKSENLAKTAEKFMVPASSVSASIKRLEKELGVELFDRSANRIRLNEHGHLLAESLGELLEKLDTSVAKITASENKPKEICILVKARRKWITELIIEYKQAHPDIPFRIFNDIRVEDPDFFDLIIDDQSGSYEQMSRFLLSAEEICVKSSLDNPLVGQTLSFRQLRNQSFVMPRKDIAIRKLLEETGKRHGFEPNVEIECNDSYCLSRYVKAGMGLTLGSRRALQGELEQGMVALDVTDFTEAQLVYVYHRKFSSANTSLQEFCSFLFQKSRIPSTES